MNAHASALEVCFCDRCAAEAAVETARFSLPEDAECEHDFDVFTGECARCEKMAPDAETRS